MARPRSPILDQDRIAAAALALVDKRGDFTMPELARQLGVQPSSLYHHVEGRTGVIELIRVRVGQAVDTTALDLPVWEEALAAWARSYRSAFAAHPRAIPLLATETVRAVDAVTMYERALGLMERAGFTGHAGLTALNTLENFILGSALDLAAPATMWDTVDSADTPRLSTALAAAPESGDRADQAFELGLTGLIAYFKHLAPTHP
ncbi:TetR/AcrR family transcriptional regulator C-terminal domain-containing protein [Streptomyces sp. NBC_01275]|uniref:TetR/AcrR family transcriptional regulator C-terminal domain-containing protein n=1 Tax=Streptomyces sp. NBC_01275 TaxID=2903807 RepID=UPI002258AB62|nr:TetR/AcrR family transcriptional regulator C-terminal domain-containing protein [Streptomyces sp. NBC_01275]MCX4761974.1 TetR/AcrR family transcriptional regulator C-terminal domain-containing protein [Streptomyces sp. NBC_01275]